MASIWEKAISILAGILNSGRCYLITAVQGVPGSPDERLKFNSVPRRVELFRISCPEFRTMWSLTTAPLHSAMHQIVIKFIYSEKATKFCEIFTLLLSYLCNVWVAKKVTKRNSVLLLCLVTFIETQTLVPVKSKVKILQNYVAFSEYMNLVASESTKEEEYWRKQEE